MRFFLISIFGFAVVPASAADWELKLAGSYSAGANGTEIVAVHAASQRAYLTVGDATAIDVLSLAEPRKPARLMRIALEVPKGGDLTSVAVHPSGEFIAVTIESTEPAKGRLELRDTKDGVLLRTLEVGVGPDAVKFSADGRWAVVCNEAEQFFYDRAARRFWSESGSVSIVDFSRGAREATVRHVAMPDLSGLPGITGAAEKRKLERSVDFDGDGRFASVIDLNGDGDTEDEGVAVGTLNGVEIALNESDGEFEIKLPLTGATPDLLEPEVAAFGADHRTAYVVLQENNTVVVIDAVDARVLRSFALGATEHVADLTDDERALFTERLRALREPDGIALTPDGKYLVTADEGDTDPKASKTRPGLPAGGGRTVSVFDATTGALLGDTGNGLDEAAAKAGVYPDARSPNKGSEPEMVVAFELDGVAHAAASLERANAAALISLADPRAPRVVAVAAIDRMEKGGKVAPEGIAHYQSPDGRHWLLTGNEKKGTLSIFELTRR
jgi:DNA-binding beta-propeller fold protein YncE